MQSAYCRAQLLRQRSLLAKENVLEKNKEKHKHRFCLKLQKLQVPKKGCFSKLNAYHEPERLSNQAIQRTRGSDLSGSWSDTIPASVARVR
jgi:hypothetical protein